jgi:hypothetical protein
VSERVFPQPQLVLGNGPVPGTQNGGLTKRELVAAMALQGLLAAKPEHYITEGATARTAMRYADELLKALAKAAA